MRHLKPVQDTEYFSILIQSKLFTPAQYQTRKYLLFPSLV